MMLKSSWESAKSPSFLVQKKLDAVKSGIKVTDMLMTRITWPRQVDAAFNSLNEASQQSKSEISKARGEARQILSETGGADADTVLEKLKGSANQQEREKLLLALPGTSRERITEARMYRMKTVSEARANADYLENILDEYRNNPDLVVQRIYQDAMEQIMTNAGEKFIVLSGGGKSRQIRIQINRDPTIWKEESKRKKEEAKKNSAQR